MKPRYELNEYVKEKGNNLSVGLGDSLTEPITLEKILNGTIDGAINLTAAGCQCAIGLIILTISPFSLIYQYSKHFYKNKK